MDPNPEVVIDLAARFALAGREDDAAVGELRAAATNKRTLRKALRRSRLGGHHLEYQHANRVYRLLEAAQTGTSVLPISSQDRERIEQIEAVMSLPAAERWAALVLCEPRLLDLQRDVLAGEYGQLGVEREEVVETGETIIGPDGLVWKAFCSVEQPGGEHDLQSELAAGQNLISLIRRLGTLVGPSSGQTDAVLRSVRAQNAATQHLMRVQQEQSA